MPTVKINDNTYKLPEIGQKNWGDLINKYMVAVASLLSSALRDFVSKTTDATISGIKNFTGTLKVTDAGVDENILTETHLTNKKNVAEDYIDSKELEKSITIVNAIHTRKTAIETDFQSKKTSLNLDIADASIVNNGAINTDNLADNSIIAEEIYPNIITNIKLNSGFRYNTASRTRNGYNVSNPVLQKGRNNIFTMNRTHTADGRTYSINSNIYRYVEEFRVLRLGINITYINQNQNHEHIVELPAKMHYFPLIPEQIWEKTILNYASYDDITRNHDGSVSNTIRRSVNQTLKIFKYSVIENNVGYGIIRVDTIGEPPTPSLNVEDVRIDKDYLQAQYQNNLVEGRFYYGNN